MMLRSAARNLPMRQLLARPNVRFLSQQVPSDLEQQAGRRRIEIDAEAKGEVIFNREPVIPAADAGTKANPILVNSGEASRVVGFQDPVTHQILWFELAAGPLHYVPDIDLYFKLNKL